MRARRRHGFFGKKILIILLVFLQTWFVGYWIFSNSAVSSVTRTVAELLSLVVVFYIIRSRKKPAYKISLIATVLLFPLFGGAFYIIYKSNILWRGMRKRLLKIYEESREHRTVNKAPVEEIVEKLPEFTTQIRYMDGFLGFPFYKNTEMKYFPSGEEMFSSLLYELRLAKKYIFLEFFIVKEGKMWSAIEEILLEKAKEGVDVRLIYDDMGSIQGFSENKIDELSKNGIKISVFNPLNPFTSSEQNNRDHRKIVSIDGRVAFTGGVNIADEYIGEIERFGHWKDAGIVLRGEGAWGFTVTFLEMWSLCGGVKENYGEYRCEDASVEAEGYVAPYADSPVDEERVGEQVYSEIIGGAKKYVYITTPYLIVDDDILSSLCLAAKSGVDVRIITPHRYDKFLVHFITRSYYKMLIHEGVKIYEYSPGFIHAKTMVSDDDRAVVGTINFDFRSFYLHFECAALIYKNKAVTDVRDDFLKTLEDSREITAEDFGRSIFVEIMQAIFRLFAPLM